MRRLILTDLDGTLTSRDLVLSPKVIEAVKLAKKHGIRIRIVTGNALPVASAISKYTGMNDYVICENGCVIGLNGVPIKFFGDPEESKRAFEYAKETLGLKPKPWNRRRFVDFVFERGADPKELEKKLRSAGFRVRVVDSGFAIHVLPEGISKASAVKRLIEHEGLTDAKIVAVGDGKNDIELFSVAHIKAAPEDGDEEVKKLADRIVSGEGNALYDVVTRLIELRRSSSISARKALVYSFSASLPLPRSFRTPPSRTPLSLA